MNGCGHPEIPAIVVLNLRHSAECVLSDPETGFKSRLLSSMVAICAFALCGSAQANQVDLCVSNALELQTALTAASGSLSPLFAHSPDIATSGDDVDGNSYATSGRIDIGAYQDTVCATNFDGDGR